MTDNEILVEMFKKKERLLYGRGFGISDTMYESVADYLISNGVVVREKGEWIEDGYYGNPLVCSYCGHEGCYSGNYGNKDYYPTNFCPNCGADMRGVNND